MHTLIIPKRHITAFRDLKADEWQELHHLCAATIEMIENLTKENVYHQYKPLLEGPDKLVCWFATGTMNHPNLGQKPHGYNQGFNEGKAAGQTVDHLHWHIIPRYNGDMEDPRGGIRHAIPALGNYQALKENM